MKDLVAVHYILSVFLLLCGVSGLCLFSWCCGLVGSMWQYVIVVIFTYFLDVCGDTELSKVASCMRCDFYSVMPDHKEASTRDK